MVLDTFCVSEVDAQGTRGTGLAEGYRCETGNKDDFMQLLVRHCKESYLLSVFLQCCQDKGYW